MRIVIADDDRLIRYSLKSMLLEISTEFEIEEARNGKELVERIEKMAPDLAFVDISMPVLDGLSAIEQCQKVSSSTKYIILTAYADFEYAKRCIRLKVQDYLLKPVSVEQLRELVEKLTHEQTDLLNKKLSQFQIESIHAFRKWRQKGYGENAFEAISQKTEGLYCVAYIYLDHPAKNDILQEAQARLLKTVHSMEKNFLHHHIYLAVLMQEASGMLLLFHCEKEAQLSLITSKLDRLCKDSTQSSYMHTCIYQDRKSLAKAFQVGMQLQSHCNMRYLARPFGATTLDEKERFSKEKAAVFSFYLQELNLSFLASDEVKYRHTLTKLKKEFSTLPKELCLASLAKFLRVSTATEISSENLKQFYNSLFHAANNMAIPQEIPTASKIAKIQDYIAENYMNDISIASLAAQFGITPNYLSSMFHEKTGKRFVEYLTEVRILNAERILKNDRNISVKDLARLTGYTSPRYFALQFKKKTGKYPTDYKKKIAC